MSLLVSSIFTANVYATQVNLRLAGNSRYDTAVAIAKGGWTQSDYAILAYGENFPDALASAPLAKKYNAPILLTESATLTPQTRQALNDLNVKNVIIVGGKSVISQEIEDTLVKIGINPTRIAGNDRYETSVKIAEQLGPITSVAVVNGDGYADALSIGSIAGKLNMPVILVPRDAIPDSVSLYLATQNIINSYVVGGTAVVGDSVVSQLPNSERISGVDRYATNIAVLDKFSSNFDTQVICFATGDGFADALTGTAYAIKNSLPIVLLPKGTNSATQDYIAKKANNLLKVVLFGGESVVPSHLVSVYLGTSPIVTIEGIGTLPSLQVAENVFVEPNFNLDTLFIATAAGSNFTHTGYLYNNPNKINTAAKAYFAPYTSSENAKKLFARAQKEDNKEKKFNGHFNEGILAYAQFFGNDLTKSLTFDPSRMSKEGTTLTEYKTCVEGFAKESNAANFFKTNLELYQSMLDDYKQNVQFNQVPRLEEFYGVSKAEDKFIVILSSIMNGGQAFDGKEMDGTLIHYNIMDPTQDYLNVLYHETAHNFFKPVKEKDMNIIRQYAPYQNAIGSYLPTDSFESALDETLARAVTVILLEKYNGKNVAIHNMNHEIGLGWKNLDEITALIKNKYLTNRNQYKTFEDFLPVILDYVKAKSQNQAFDVGLIEKIILPKNGLVLGGKEDSEKFRKFSLPISKNGWGWVNEIKEHDLVVWLDYPDSQSPQEVKSFFTSTITGDKNYLSIKATEGKILVHLRAESKDKLISILEQFDIDTDFYTETYRTF